MKTMGIADAASGITFRTALRRWRRDMASLFDPYRPELHYMRGPGPKCREKQALAERGL